MDLLSVCFSESEGEMAAEIRNMEYRMSVGKKILFGLMLTAAVYVVILFFLMLTGVKLYIVTNNHFYQ